jgi:hypothetical protein
LGRCQIDVLCRAERFDLIVRTEEALAPPLCREVRELYVAARDAAGLLGDVRFRPGEWILLPQPGEAARAGAGITV